MLADCLYRRMLIEELVGEFGHNGDDLVSGSGELANGRAMLKGWEDYRPMRSRRPAGTALVRRLGDGPRCAVRRAALLAALAAARLQPPLVELAEIQQRFDATFARMEAKLRRIAAASASLHLDQGTRSPHAVTFIPPPARCGGLRGTLQDPEVGGVAAGKSIWDDESLSLERP